MKEDAPESMPAGDVVTTDVQRTPPSGLLDSIRATLPDVSPEMAYFLPMGVFLGLVWVGGNWPGLYPWAYLARTLIVAAVLVWLWPRFTKIRWDYWWLGAIVGVIGIFQWIGMQQFLQTHVAFFRPGEGGFNPFEQYTTTGPFVAFVVMRMIGASLVVPVMEELFWRDYLWRSVIAPNDFKLASVGEWDWKAFLGTSLLFAVVHGNWWLTSIVWALMVAALLVKTKSIGACIIAHGVTNLLLGIYVLVTKQWQWW